MDIDLLGYVVRQLRATPRHEWPQIAEKSGVPRSSLEKIAYGIHTNPGAQKVQRIAGVLMNSP